MSLSGQFYDGRTATSHEVMLDLDEDGVLRISPALIEPIPLARVRISERIGSIASNLTFPCGAVFETDDHATLDNWLQAHSVSRNAIHQLENSTRNILAAIAFVALFVVWTYFYGIPWASTKLAYALPEKASIGQGTLESLDERFFSDTRLSDDRRLEIEKKFSQLLPSSSDFEQIQYKLEFRRGGVIGANAFALPDGTVVITDELIDLAEHDEEIFSVLLHEIGHVEHRHSLRQVISHSGLAVVTVLITGDVNTAGGLILALPNLLLNSSYSRDYEWEADGYALTRMQALNIPPERFADFMLRIEAYVPEYVVDEDRVDNESQKEESIESEVGIESDNSVGDEEEIAESKLECQQSTSEDSSVDVGWFNYLSSHPSSDDRIKRFRTASQ